MKRYQKIILLIGILSTLLYGCDKKEPTEDSLADEVLVTGKEVTVEDNDSSKDVVVPEKDIKDYSDLNAFKDELTVFLDKKPFQGTILVAKDDEIILKKAYGYADAENQILNQTDTIYEIGSLTKQFTAAAIMMLVEDGLLSVDDTLDKYLPEYPHAEKITIKQLLNMTSGVMNFFEDRDYLQRYFGVDNQESMYHQRISKEIKNEELLGYISEFELSFEPGTKYAYSNTNYHFLGMILEKVTGMSYQDYIAENILEPLGMTSTSFDPNNTTAIGYAGEKNGIPIPIMSPHPTISYSAGAICTNVDDLFKWEKAVMAGELLSEKSWAEVFDGGVYGYGYGWYIYGSSYAHAGGTFGFNSYVTISPKDNYVIIVLANNMRFNAITKGNDIYLAFSDYFVNNK